MVRTSLFAAVVVLTLTLSLPSHVAAQTPAKSPETRLSLLAYGDYFWVAQHHQADLEHRNGFWFRRIYLTVDQSLSETLSARLRFEVNQPGDFKSSLTLDPYVKDAWLKWRRSDALQFVAGILSTPTWESVEEFWGYRSVEKTPLDLQRMGSSRDFGVAVLGRLGSHGLRYHVTAGNGSGVQSETNTGKQITLFVGVEPLPQTTLELYADRDDRPGDTDRTTAQIFAGWRRENIRIGLQYATQKRQLGSGRSVNLDIASAFLVYRIRPTVATLFRVDRMFDPNPEGDRIPYLPFDPTRESTLVIAGVDLRLHPRFGIVPNVEAVTYGGSDSDLIPRLTFYYSF